MKKLVNTVVVNGKEVTYEITADASKLTLNSNRMGAFTCIHRNFNGRVLYANTLQEMKSAWFRLIEEGYVVEDVVKAPAKQSLYTMKFIDANGKEISGRAIYAKEKSRRKAEHIKANNFFKGVTGQELRKYMDLIEQKVKEEMKVWEADYIASLQ